VPRDGPPSEAHPTLKVHRLKGGGVKPGARSLKLPQKPHVVLKHLPDVMNAKLLHRLAVNAHAESEPRHPLRPPDFLFCCFFGRRGQSHIKYFTKKRTFFDLPPFSCILVGCNCVTPQDMGLRVQVRVVATDYGKQSI
jgi:hypothetical protein